MYMLPFIHWTKEGRLLLSVDFYFGLGISLLPADFCLSPSVTFCLVSPLLSPPSQHLPFSLLSTLPHFNPPLRRPSPLPTHRPSPTATRFPMPPSAGAIGNPSPTSSASSKAGILRSSRWLDYFIRRCTGISWTSACFACRIGKGVLMEFYCTERRRQSGLVGVGRCVSTFSSSPFGR